MHLTYFTRV